MATSGFARTAQSRRPQRRNPSVAGAAAPAAATKDEAKNEEMTLDTAVTEDDESSTGDSLGETEVANSGSDTTAEYHTDSADNTDGTDHTDDTENTVRTETAHRQPDNTDATTNKTLVVINNDGSVSVDHHALVIDLRDTSTNDPHAIVDTLTQLRNVDPTDLRDTTTSALTDAITRAALNGGS